MNKKKLLWIVPILVVAVIALLLVISFRVGREKAATGGDGSIAILLEQLKNGDEYCYKELEWGSSVQSIEKLFPCEIEKNTDSSLPNNLAIYNAKTPFVLNDVIGTVSCEFQDDKLKSIKFSCHLGEDCWQWFDARVEELIRLYGKESDKMENSSDKYSSVGYKWDTNDTTLQIILMTGDSVTPSFTLGVGAK